MTLAIVSQKQPPGLHESRQDAFGAYHAGSTLTSAQKTVCRAATLGLYAGQDSGAIWWVQCSHGWATGGTQSAIEAYCAAVLVETSWVMTAEPSAEFTALVSARAKWAALNFFKVRCAEPGSLMFDVPKRWDYENFYGLTCGDLTGQVRAKPVHPTAMKLALDALGVPASV